MKTLPKDLLRGDLLKLLCLTGAIAATVGIFIVTPSLSSPTVISLILSTLLSPLVTVFERKGFSRRTGIAIVFLILAFVAASAGYWLIQSGIQQWALFKERTPEQFNLALTKLREFEDYLKLHFPVLSDSHPTETLLKRFEESRQWFVEKGPNLMGQVLTWFSLVPPLTFFLLNEGRNIRKAFYQLVPNRFFESFFLITTDITAAISDYLRAKLLEAFLVGMMVAIGIALIRAPYAIVLGILAGITNIVPYVGPVVGTIPGVLITVFDATQHHNTIPIVLVYFAANLVDSMVIFPLLVAKLVKLHPLLLVAVVAVGQQYYGLIGMLISVPIAAAVKVILQEIYTLIYKQKLEKTGSSLSLNNYSK